MNRWLGQISILLILLSVISFAIGFVMLFIANKRKTALNILLFAVIVFVIGFGTCVATINR